MKIFIFLIISFSAIASPNYNSTIIFIQGKSAIVGQDHPMFHLQSEITKIDTGNNGQIKQVYNLDLKVFLEGAFAETDMRTDLNQIIPLNQPYHIAPFHYFGSESVDQIPNQAIVDWILVELRRSSGTAMTAIPDSIILRKALFLLSDGTVVDLDGFSLPTVDLQINGNIFGIIQHRNHLGIISAAPLQSDGSTLSFDYSDGFNKVYGGYFGHKDLGSGVFGLIAGDMDANKIIDQNDKLYTWQEETGREGYYAGDANTNRQVDNWDKNELFLQNMGKYSFIPADISCSGTITDTRDGRAYKIIQVGNQCWMAENLNIGSLIDNETQPGNNGIIEKYCYNNEEDTCEIFGGLYQWDELMNYTTAAGTTGICPAGWHIPAHAEWQILEGNADSEYGVGDPIWWNNGSRGYNSGLNLKSTTGWNSNGNGLDIFGINIIPGGLIYSSGIFYYFKDRATFWTSTESSASAATGRSFSYIFDGSTNLGATKTTGFSIRCIRDQ